MALFLEDARIDLSVTVWCNVSVMIRIEICPHISFSVINIDFPIDNVYKCVRSN